MNRHNLTLAQLPGTYAVAQLEPHAILPGWVQNDGLVSITRTPEELSIVCEQAQVPESIKAQRGFRGLRVLGPLDFSETGILACLAVPLAEAGISIFAISTYDTDYLLLPEEKLEVACAVLRNAGHTILGTPGDG